LDDIIADSLFKMFYTVKERTQAYFFILAKDKRLLLKSHIEAQMREVYACFPAWLTGYSIYVFHCIYFKYFFYLNIWRYVKIVNQQNKSQLNVIVRVLFSKCIKFPDVTFYTL